MGLPKAIATAVTKALKDIPGAIKSVGKEISDSSGARGAYKEIAEDVQEGLLQKASGASKKELKEAFHEGVQQHVKKASSKEMSEINNLLAPMLKEGGDIPPSLMSKIRNVFPDEASAKEIARSISDKTINLKTFKSNAKKRIMLAEYRKQNNIQEAGVRSLYTKKMSHIEKELSKVHGDDLQREVMRSQILYKYHAAGKKGLDVGHIEKRNMFQRAFDLTQNINSKLDSVFALHASKGYKAGMAAVTAVKSFIDGLEGSSTKVKNLLLEMSGKLKELDDPVEDAVIQYLENFKPERVKLINPQVDPNSGIAFNKAIMKDAETLAEIAAKTGVELKDEHIMLANRIHNMMRPTIKKLEQNVDNGIYDASWMANRLDDIADDGGSLLLGLDNNFSSMSVKDYGANYFPAVGNEAHKAMLNSKNAKTLMDDVFKPTDQFWKGRKENSLLRDSPELYRARPSEALKVYAHKMDMFLGKKTGDKLINDLGLVSTVMSPIKTNESLFKNVGRLKDIKDQWENIHKMRAEIPDNFLVKSADVLIDLHKKAALASPKMTGVNLFQPLTNNVTKPPFEVLMSMAKTTTLLGESLFTGKNMREVAKIRANRNPSSLATRVQAKYLNHFKPDLNAARLDMAGADSRIKSMSNWMTTLYTMSDTFTRATALHAGVNHFEKTLAKHARLKGADPAKFMEKMSKDLNLNSFGAVDRHVLTNKLMGEVDDFAYEYAKRATELEIFNYGKYGRPEILDMAKSNPLAANALSLISWPMYWTKTMGGAISSMRDGNPKPFIGMLGVAAAWYTAATALKNNDDTEKLGQYLTMRTPMINPAMFFIDFTDRGLAGIMQPTIDLFTLPIYEVGVQVNSIGGGVDDYWTYSLEEKKRRLGGPIGARLKDVKNVFDDPIDMAIELYEEYR